jgi:hypothetical protein
VRLIPEPTVGAVKGSRVEIARENPTLPHQGLVWRGGAELLAKEIGFHHGVSESVLAMDGYASCLS